MKFTTAEAKAFKKTYKDLFAEVSAGNDGWWKIRVDRLEAVDVGTVDDLKSFLLSEKESGKEFQTLEDFTDYADRMPGVFEFPKSAE